MTHVSSMLDYVLQIIWSCLSLFVYISKHMSRLQMAAEEFSLPIYHPSEATEGKRLYRWSQMDFLPMWCRPIDHLNKINGSNEKLEELHGGQKHRF